jgi:ubiquitin fusion degradation protein 1
MTWKRVTRVSWPGIPSRTLTPRPAVLLPPSVLEQLGGRVVQYPLKFRLERDDLPLVAHCGVREFTAEPGRAYLPWWLMEAMGLGEGSIVRLVNVALPDATYLKIRPRKTAFVQLTDPKGVLEVALRNFTCVTKGVTLRIQYIGRSFDIDVLELEPADAASIVETDVELDFAEPLDYKATEAADAGDTHPEGALPAILASPEAREAAQVALQRRRQWLAEQASSASAAPETKPRVVLGDDIGGRILVQGTIPPPHKRPKLTLGP